LERFARRVNTDDARGGNQHACSWLCVDLSGPITTATPLPAAPAARARVAHAAAVPEITTAITYLRDVLGDQTYESLARKGEVMTTAAMVTYANDQIDQARTTLEHPS
jgi:hypothetical protein